MQNKSRNSMAWIFGIGLLVIGVFVGLTAADHTPTNETKNQEKWASEGCWVYKKDNCEVKIRGFAGQVTYKSEACEMKSDYKTHFTLDDRVYKPYPVCAAK